jgi:hypothetical protein
MIQTTPQDLEQLFLKYLGKPHRIGATGPDAYDCWTLIKSVMAELGADLPDVNYSGDDLKEVYDRAVEDYRKLDVPRAWSLVTFEPQVGLNPHMGIVLPEDNLFLHCPARRGDGRVCIEPLNRRPWRDKIDGYYWPKGLLETVVMLTPMTSTKRAYGFLRADGRTLKEIIAEDIPGGAEMNLQAFMGGQKVEDFSVVPTDEDQLVIRPMMADGEWAMWAGMIGLAILAPWAVGAIAPGMTAAATSGAAGWFTNLAYGLSVGAVAMGGSLALNALVGVDAPDSREEAIAYTFQGRTTQQVGAFLPLVYGTHGIKGNIAGAHGEDGNTFSGQHITAQNPKYNLKIAYSEGPIEGLVANTAIINGRPADAFDVSVTVEHFEGTDIQAASTVPDAFEIPVNKRFVYETPLYQTFTAVNCKRVGIVQDLPSGLIYYHSDGDRGTGILHNIVKIRPSGGSWHTLADGNFTARTTKPVRLTIWSDQTYTGGSGPFTITAGQSYEVSLEQRNLPSSRNLCDGFWTSIQCEFDTAQIQKLPGVAYTAIGAVASKEISGTIDFSGIIEGKVVRTYNGATWTIEWSDNPAWVAYDLLTRPVISGDGGGTAYAVDYYRGMDPSYLDTNDFYAFAQWCDTMVDDGDGGTEKQYRFNGIFDREMTAWESAMKVCKMACGTPWFSGHIIRVAIDKTTTASQLFCASNIRTGFTETYFDKNETATQYDVRYNDEEGGYIPQTLTIARKDAASEIGSTMDGFGHTKRSQVWRRARRQLRVNQYMRRMIELPVSLDSIYTVLGDVVHVQHPAQNRATGARITIVNSTSKITVSESLTMGAGTYSVVIRTISAGDEYVTSYTVTSITGADNNEINISGTFTYTPSVNDIVSFGEAAKVTDLYRVKAFERKGDGKAVILATQYTSDYYTDDTGTPEVEADNYDTGSGSLAPSTQPASPQWFPTDDEPEVVEGVIYEGVAFSGNGTDTVTWANSGEGIKYQGTWYDTTDDATGTTESYIYFDPNVGDPKILQVTSDLSDLAGQERFVMCVNINGVAYPKDGLRVGQDGQFVSLDDMPISGMGNNVFDETFEDPFGDVANRWLDYAGNNAELSIETGGEAGGKVLRVGNNSGVDTAWLIYGKSIPFDRSKLYRIRIRIRRTAGTGTVYVGVAGRNSTDTAWVNAAGSDSVTGQHYYGAYNEAPGATWEEFVGYFKGAGTTDTAAHPDPQDPGQLHANVYYFRPMIVVNYTGVAGTTEIDECVIEEAALGEDANIDDLVVGGKTLEEFHFYAQTTTADAQERWGKTGAANISIVSGGVSGGKAMQMGDAAGDDETWGIYTTSLPFSPNFLYRVRVRAKMTSGTGKAYLGLAGRNGDDDAWVNVNGADSAGSQHYVAASDVTIPGSWKVYEGYIRGLGATGDAGEKPSPSDPGVMHDDVRYFRPMFIVNYTGVAGITLIDEFTVDIIPDQIMGSYVSPEEFGAKMDGTTDDATAINDAIDAAITAGRTLHFREGTYAIGSTLEFGDGLSEVVGLKVQSSGMTTLKWIGSGTDTMAEFLCVSNADISGLYFNGNSVTGTTGIYWSSNASYGAKRNTMMNCYVQNCPVIGVSIFQNASKTCDYFEFIQCSISYNGVNMKVAGGTREINLKGGSYLDAATYTFHLTGGHIYGFGMFMANAGTCDIYLDGQITGFHLYGCSSESQKILDTSAAAQSASAKLSPNILSGFWQDDGTTPSAAVITYDMYKPLMLIGCKFQHNVDLGSNTVSTIAQQVEFSTASTGFTGAGADSRLMELGDDDGPGFKSGALQVIFGGSSYPDGFSLRNVDDDYTCSMFRGGAEPDSYYYKKGDIVWNDDPDKGDVIAWICVLSGDFETESVKAGFVQLGILGDGDTPQDTVTAKTGNYTLTAADNHKTFSNEGATGSTVMTLPTATPGYSFRFIRIASESFAVAAAGTDAWQGRGTSDLELSADDTCIEIKCFASGYWRVTGAFGTTTWY